MTGHGAHPSIDPLVFRCLYTYFAAMTVNARWNLVVSQNTDDTLRQFLASQGRGRKGELSRFVEDAVRSRILELEAEQAKVENSDRPSAMIEDAVDEALEWARRA